MVAIVAVVWITGLFVTLAFVAGATRWSRYPEPKPDPDEGEDDLLAGTAEALADVYGETGPLPPPPLDRGSDAILERRVVRASRPGRAPIH